MFSWDYVLRRAHRTPPQGNYQIEQVVTTMLYQDRNLFCLPTQPIRSNLILLFMDDLGDPKEVTLSSYSTCQI